MSSQLRDKYLLYRIQTKRDPDAYAELYDKNVAGVYRFISFKVGSREEAEDITSEVFLRAWHYLLESHDVSSFSGLAYRIARNLVVDHYRSKRANVSLDEQIEKEDETGEGSRATDIGEQIKLIDTKAEASVIIKAMQQLKEDYRDVLMLKFVEDLSISEISEIIGKSNVHTRVLIHRATKTLKETLEKHDQGRKTINE